MRQRSMRCIWSLFIAGSVLPFTGVTAQTYSVVEFASLEGGYPFISVAAINAHGVSVGTLSIGHSQAISSDGVALSFLPRLRMDDQNAANGINDNGLVTGWSASGAGTITPSHAYLYNTTTADPPTDLGTLAGAIDSVGNAINSSGQVTGYATVAIHNVEHAFLYSGGNMIDLGTLPGGTSSHGNAINDSGLVVGGADTAHGDMHAVVTQGNSLIDIGTLAGGVTGVGYTSEAFAVNNAGQIVGSTSVLPSASHAFLYSGGKMTDLGTLGGLNSSANGINGSGEVVGSSDTNTGGSAFLYANGVMTDLNSLVDPSDPLFGKVTLESAAGINDSGWIVVNGYRNDPNAPIIGAFLLVPLGLAPRSLTFADQPVGTQSASQPITLTNLAITPLAITGIASSSPFTQSNDCPAALTSGSSCTIQVGFAPLAYGSVSGVLKVTTATTTFTLPAALKGGGYIAVSMNPSATSVTVGMPVTLTWTSYSTTTCTATGGTAGDGWGGTVPANGTKSVVEKVAATYTYTLTCPVGGTSPQASVTVEDSAPPSGGGGGGEMDWLTLGTVLGALVAVRRRAGRALS